ncbi:MAG: ATP synthase subunit I [Desulfomonile tiedjei]|nr:ATP synthase subunit I [Desulfomonile tiedjei]
MDFDKVPGVWFKLSAFVYTLGLVCSLIFAGQAFSLGFSIGGALVLLNAWAAARRLRRAEFPHKGRVMASVLGGFYMRLILLAICLFGVIKFVKVDPVGLVTGLSVVPAGLFVMLVLIYLVNRRPEEV